MSSAPSLMRLVRWPENWRHIMDTDNAGTLALRSLLNCVAREYPDRVNWSRKSGELRFTLSFPQDGGYLELPAAYRSATGHHLFGGPVMLVKDNAPRAVSAAQAVAAIIERLEPSPQAKDGRDDLLNRAQSSRLLIEAAFEQRAAD